MLHASLCLYLVMVTKDTGRGQFTSWGHTKEDTGLILRLQHCLWAAGNTYSEYFKACSILTRRVKGELLGEEM